MTTFTQIPTSNIGPVRISTKHYQNEIQIPIATYETTLWPSMSRGARVSRKLDKGFEFSIIDERMTRSILLEAKSAEAALDLITYIKNDKSEIQNIVSSSSRFAKFINSHSQIVGNYIYLRLEFTTGDAAGHNMTTKAADSIIKWICGKWPDIQYVSVSANYCTDKKNNSVDGILGRGKYVIGEALISREICEKDLKTTPEKISALNTKKNLIGSILSGGVRTANAHFANMLLGVYLATGQDAANIVEGSQGITYAEVRNDSLYFSVTLPNVIVGTIGNGKDLEHVKTHMDLIDCSATREVGENSRRLAVVVGAAVMCGELSIMAAQTNIGELMEGHLMFERHDKK